MIRRRQLEDMAALVVSVDSTVVSAAEPVDSTVTRAIRTAGTRSSNFEGNPKIWMTSLEVCSVECLEDMAESGEHPVPAEAALRAADSMVVLAAVVFTAAADSSGYQGGSFHSGFGSGGFDGFASNGEYQSRGRDITSDLTVTFDEAASAATR